MHQSLLLNVSMGSRIFILAVSFVGHPSLTRKFLIRKVKETMEVDLNMKVVKSRVPELDHIALLKNLFQLIYTLAQSYAYAITLINNFVISF